MKIIEVKNLTKDYGNGLGVFNINFSVRQGEIFGVFGEDGSGKTTLAKLILGKSEPQIGSAKIFEDKQLVEQKQTIGYCLTEDQLFEDMTGWEYLAHVANLKNITSLTYAKELVRIFGLSLGNKKIKCMKKNEKQKLRIVSSVLQKPNILIFDEPTKNLNEYDKDCFYKFILSQKENGKTVLIFEKMDKNVEMICDHICVLKSGKMVDNCFAGAYEFNDRSFVKTQKLEVRYERYKKNTNDCWSGVLGGINFVTF